MIINIDNEYLDRNTHISVFEKLTNIPIPQCGQIYGKNLAYYPHIPINVLAQLANHPSLDIRTEVASNPNTPAHVLEKLVSDCDSEVSYLANCNPNLLLSWNKQTRIEMFNKLAQNTDENLGRLAVFFSPYADVSTLVENYRSTVWLERYAIAQNPSTPVNILNHLAQEGNVIVREAAKHNLTLVCS